MQAIFRCIICLFLVLPIGCWQHSTAEQVACKMTCKQRLDRCISLCQDCCGKCSLRSTAAATGSYNQYKREQCVQGKSIVRQLQSFRDPLKCRKTTCECSADYDVCMQSSSGVIHKQLQVVPACC